MMEVLRRHAHELTGDTEASSWARMRVHVVRNPIMDTLGFASKLNTEWDFLSMLKQEGRKAADLFLSEQGGRLGTASTVDFDQLLAML